MTAFTHEAPTGDDLIADALRLEDVEDLAPHGALLDRARARLGVTVPDVHLQGRLVLLEARRLAQTCDYERGYARSLEAGRLLDIAGDAPRTVRAASVCVGICIETGDPVRALELAQRALAKAREIEDPDLQSRLLANLAVMFMGLEDHESAARCAREIVRLDAPVPGHHDYGLALLANLHLREAERLERQGFADAAAAHRRQAAEGLPPVDAGSALPVLNVVVRTLGELRDIAGAHRAALLAARSCRAGGRPARWRIHTWLTLGLFHVHAGRPDKGIVRIERAIRQMRATGRIDELVKAEHQVATAHAAAGRYDEALLWARRSRADCIALHPERVRLRGHRAALERGAEIDELERRTTVLHTQRLAVVGRLMAQIYHALEAPIAEARATLGACIDAAQEPRPEALENALRAVVERIDEAAGVARQLKMFSYRAAPQTMELDLPEALQEAWQGMSIGRAGPVAPLRLDGSRPPPVRVDAQRLAVLLRILLIEMERMGSAAPPSVALAMRGQAVRVELTAHLPGFGPGAEASVGFMLCQEIAREMHGSLTRVDDDAGLVHLQLELPADPQREAGLVPQPFAS
jgi:tetratricopeptide (TPR) repeat protein